MLRAPRTQEIAQMARGRPKAQLHLSTEERAQLQGVASSRALPHGLVRRVQIVLASADGEPNSAIAQWD
jgi:putative transposase